MAKITPEERQLMARVARTRLIRSFALTGVINFYNAEDFCVLNSYRKMDVAECCKYYLAQGWMRGEVLRASSEGIRCCNLNAWHQCAIIAHCPIEEAELTIEQVRLIEESNWVKMRHSYDKASPLFVKVTTALNAYCRCHPAVLALFDGLGDLPTIPPSDQEQELAQEKWNSMKAELLTEDHYCDCTTLFSPIILQPEFKEFFYGISPMFFYRNIEELFMQHERLKRISQKEFQYVYSFLSDANDHPWKPIFDSLGDQLLFFQSFLFEGDIDGHLARMHKGTKCHTVLSAIKELMVGNAHEAVQLIEKDLSTNQSILYGDTYCNFIYLASLLQDDKPTAKKKAETIAKKKEVKTCSMTYVKLMLEMKINPSGDMAAWVKANGMGYPLTNLADAIFALIAVPRGWADHLTDNARNYIAAIKHSGMLVLALDFAQNFEQMKENLPTIEQATGMHPIMQKVVVRKPWETLLETMIKKYATEKTSEKDQEKKPHMDVSRIVYHINTMSWDVQPRLQKSKDGGVTWSGGRNMALNTFQRGTSDMTSVDKIIARHVNTYSYGWYGGSYTSLCGEEVIAELVGHPAVFDMLNPDIKIEILEEKLQVVVNTSKKGYTVSFNVNSDGDTYHRINIIKENAQMLKVVKLSMQEIELLHFFDRIKTFPPEAQEQLTKLLTALGKKVTVMSPLLADAENVTKKTGDSMLTIQLVPYGEVFTVRSYVKPLITTPPYCTPGQGLEYITTNIKGETVHITRNLKAEKKNQEEFVGWMEPFAAYETEEGWQLPIEDCLAVLDLLRQHKDKCHIEWPEGVRFTVRRPMINADQLRLNVKGVGHWFEVDGEVSIDKDTNMKVSDLLKRVREAKGQFIQLDDAEYIAISHQLKKQLTELDRILQPEKKTLKLSEYNSQFLSDMQQTGVTLESDTSFTSLLSRIEESDKVRVRVPKTLQAELRDYQMEGFKWLTRLAHWGAGACLADDMGLGKTVQTIALLLSRSAQGASLVVMPTSVLINWQNEIQRFAPTLHVVVLRNAASRKEAIENAGPGDVVLSTYGLLVTEEEILTSRPWNIIVLDEAHTIKNRDTKMSKVAMQMNGNFRLLLTGTPLQNHLSEIWNLFQFATPGLLTGYKQFTQEFILPIERDGEKNPQRMLKRMLSPFILRRTKNEVLNELPEKTEITLKVELSEMERALYDQLRKEAQISIEEGGNTSAMKALAEITRLRQAACNAALVLPAKEAKKIPSSKCEAFLKLVDELIQNHHRALVFSQFTSHLALIEKELKNKGIEYQYLDGAVSPTERIRRVDEFQKGEQPLFLISLKAGGTGLNLTSADYVIHLDPWWNPSIEDQASDRAYRIGQDKPVTVYRLIAADTIEEKIIALHQTKKSLADALLEGSDMAHKLTKDEIIELLCN